MYSVLVEKFEDTKWVIRSRKSKEKIIQWPQEMFEDTKGVIRRRKSKEKIIQWPQEMFEDTKGVIRNNCKTKDNTIQ